MRDRGGVEVICVYVYVTSFGRTSFTAAHQELQGGREGGRGLGLGVRVRESCRYYLTSCIIIIYIIYNPSHTSLLPHRPIEEGGSKIKCRR